MRPSRLTRPTARMRRHHADRRRGDDRPGAPPELGPDGLPKRRRRRGSRGGRNRKKPGRARLPARPTVPAAPATRTTTTPSDEDDDDLAENENDASADRGLTTDDVAAVAMEDAGLVEPGIVRAPVDPAGR